MLETFLQTITNLVDIVCTTFIAKSSILVTKSCVSMLSFAFVEIILKNDITIHNSNSEVVKVFRNLMSKYSSL